MKTEIHDRGDVVRPFTRAMGDWSQTAQRLSSLPRGLDEVHKAMQAQMQADVRRARREAWLAWAFTLLIATAAGIGGWGLKEKVAWLEEERAVLLAQLSEKQARVDQLTDAGDRMQHDLAALRQDTSVSSETLLAARNENKRLRREVEETNRRLKEAQQREAQARARWAYADGERDALYEQLTAMITRIESALQMASQREKLAPVAPVIELSERESPAEDFDSSNVETEDDEG